MLLPHDGENYAKQSVCYKNPLLCFVMLFPMLENAVMKQHAVYYSYDRMKLVFFLVLLLCDLLNIVLNSRKWRLGIAVMAAAVLLGAKSIRQYKHLDNSYVWRAPYRKQNEQLRDYIRANYSGAVMGLDISVRGYINCLFHNGVYEWIASDALLEIAQRNNNRYAVLLHEAAQGGWWNMYILGDSIYDIQTGQKIEINQKDGGLVFLEREKYGQ